MNFWVDEWYSSEYRYAEMSPRLPAKKRSDCQCRQSVYSLRCSYEGCWESLPRTSCFHSCRSTFQAHFSTTSINAGCNVDRFLYNLIFATDMIMDHIKKHDCIHAFQRTLLPFFRNWKYFIHNTTDCCIGDLQIINIPDMRLEIRGRHTLGIHENDLALHILWDTSLIQGCLSWTWRLFP